MNITIYHWNKIPVEKKEKILKRAELDMSAIEGDVKKILTDIRQMGDEALIAYIEKFDGIRLKSEKLKVSEQEILNAENELSPAFKDAIRVSMRNVKEFHKNQAPSPMTLAEVSKGVFAGEKSDPIPSLAIYVPRGKGSFPSMLYMLALPAIIAGVDRIIVATPPDKEGRVDPGTLFTARECGIKEIYKISGVQAIGSLAYGTETIPKVDMVTGPGSAWVTAAKKALYGTIDVGIPAGPSESVILADATADPGKVALDFLTEAEHGPDSASILVTDSLKLGEKVREIASSIVKDFPEERRGFISTNMDSYSGIIICDNMNEAVDFVNEYAPEHLMIVTDNPFDYLSRIKNASEILLGEYSPFSLANYSIGPNAVLPTGGFAKTYSPVSVRDFVKYSSVSYVTEKGFQDLSGAAQEIAEYEGFASHAEALRRRGQAANIILEKS